jgi:hypothetical protein
MKPLGNLYCSWMENVGSDNIDYDERQKINVAWVSWLPNVQPFAIELGHLLLHKTFIFEGQ